MRTQIPGHLYYDEEGKLVKVILPQEGVLTKDFRFDEDRYIEPHEIKKLKPYFTLPDKKIHGRFSLMVEMSGEEKYLGEVHILDANEDGTLNLVLIEENDL